MAFKVGSTTQANIPATASADRGSYLVSAGDGTAYWSYLGGTQSATQINGSSWEYRSVYTHGFLAAGYKGSNPWRTVNKTWHATEVTMYCGEQIAFTQGYTNGMWSDQHAYCIAGAGFNNATDIVCSYSLHNGTIRTFTADGFSSDGVAYGYQGNDPKNKGLDYGTAGYQGDVGGMKMSVAKLDPPATQNIIGQDGYVSGGNDTSTQKLHFPTEVMYVTTAAAFTGRGDASYGQTRGWFAFAANTAYLTFSNDSWTSGGWSRNTTDVHSKMLGSKKGHFYSEDGANVTLPKAKFNDSTGSRISTFNKVRAYGEANYEDGQDNGYCMGHYDGQQNNHTIRQSYSSDTEVTLPAAAQPKGHYGQSSGACSTGAATITAQLA